MSNKRTVIRPDRCPSIVSCAAVVGKKEYEGPLGNQFDYHDEKGTFGRETWEQAEGEMQHMALNLALTKAKWQNDALNAIFAGDLINQCTCSNYGLLDTEAPYFGLYGACSTSAEALILGTVLFQIPGYDKIALVTSSHNCTAERQFRYPVEYGGLRAPTGQYTVTGAASFLLGDGEGCYISEAMPGISRDLGITDINNMGAAMAPVSVKLRPYPVPNT